MSKIRNGLATVILIIFIIAGFSGAASPALADHNHGDEMMAAGQSIEGTIVNTASLIIVAMATLLLVVRIRANASYLPKMTARVICLAGPIKSFVC
ncbi:hypothetical protein [Paenibacillus sp. N3.4]|uniref:hypothetical protein n=1 Tax=Paenibacillus sp. N3.4 TaxID=2603222 RepID=UPI0011C8456A|nr:hypothetical protein [Paenibacillus sp. N3.4]TXK85010.1 hypothetical protein FU659_05775 [Paenibacillus sp. N3.4]